MKKIFFLFLFISTISLGLFSCSNSSSEESTKTITLIADDSGFDDMSFNYSGKQGLERLVEKYGVKAVYQTPGLDGERQYLLTNAAKSSDLVICLGYTFAEDLSAVAQINSEHLFSIIDFCFIQNLSNVHCATFEVNQAAMPLGYLAANYLYNLNSNNTNIAFLGGEDTDEINKFYSGFEKGIQYYNDKYSKNIELKKEYVNSYDDSAKAYQMTKTLIENGAKIIFPPSGKSGLGAFAAAKDLRAFAIGYDSDCSITMPQYSDIILSSCLKRIDNAVYSIGEFLIKNNDIPHSAYVGTLENLGVGIAPYYTFDSKLADSTKNEVNGIIQKIINKEITF